MSTPASQSDHVHYGCGLCAPPTWRNFDASPTLRLQRLPLLGKVLRGRSGPVFPRNVEYGDIVSGLPIREGLCQAIYCSHVLEHLALHDFRTALANTLRYLRADGVFRCVVPDLRHLAKAYLDSTEESAALRFMEDSALGMKDRPRGVRGYIRDALGHSKHCWMWDYESLAGELRKAGFASVRRAALGDCRDPLFRDVESPERWQNAVGVEATKS